MTDDTLQQREKQQKNIGNNVTIDSKQYDPELDPNSTQFNLERYAKFLSDESEKLQSNLTSINSFETNTMQQVKQIISNKIQSDIKNLTENFLSFYNSDLFKNTIEMIRLTFDSNDAIRNNLEVRESLQPYLEAELKKPEYEGKTLSYLLKHKNISSYGLLERAIVNARLAKLVTESFPQLQSTGTPKYYTSPNTVLTNALQANDGKEELIGAGATDIPVLDVGKPNEVTIYVNATLENMEGIKLTGKPYTEYDRAVHDSIVSLYEDRKKHSMPPVMTADMVYRTMTYKTNNEFVSPQQRGAVTKSIEKMRRNISIYLDATEELKRRDIRINGKPIDSFTIDEFLLTAERMTIKAGGETAVAYLIKSEPLLLKYAKLNGQLITVKGDLLDIREVDNKGHISNISISNNENRIAIKSYLLRRIEIIRSDQIRAHDAFRKYNARCKKSKVVPIKTISDFIKQSHIILFESLFSTAGITASNTKTRSRIYIYQVLDYWKASGSIKGYKQRKKGKTVDAVIIEI